MDALLDINKLESGAITPVMTEIGVHQLLQRMKCEFQTQAKIKGVELHTVPSNATILSDERLLERIIHNFLSNALNYTVRGRVLLGCRRRASSGFYPSLHRHR